MIITISFTLRIWVLKRKQIDCYLTYVTVPFKFLTLTSFAIWRISFCRSRQAWGKKKFSFQDRIHKIRNRFEITTYYKLSACKFSYYRNSILEANASISIGINETNNFIKIARNLDSGMSQCSRRIVKILELRSSHHCVHGFVK